MKYGSIKAVCFVVLACAIVMPAFSDGQTVDLTSIIVESFNGDATHEWNDGRHPRIMFFRGHWMPANLLQERLIRTETNWFTPSQPM